MFEKYKEIINMLDFINYSYIFNKFKMLAKKITETRKAKQPDPFKKIEFIKLSNIAIEIVA